MLVVVTPSARTSGATPRSHVSNAFFDAMYALHAIGGMSTPVVATLTMWPSPRSRIDGSSASSSRTGPR
jgi:hypothetical protein